MSESGDEQEERKDPEKDSGEKTADTKHPKGDTDSDGAEKDEAAEEEAEEDDGPPLYKKPLFWIIGGIVLLVLIIGGLLYWLHARQFVSTDDAFVDAHIVRISPEVSGRIIQVANIDNRHIQAGRLLAAIEPMGPGAQLEQAKAGVAQAQADYLQARAQIAAAEAQRAQAAASAAGPAAQAIQARHDLERYLTLRRLDAAAAAPTQIDQARAEADSRASQAAAARRQVDSAAAQVVVARRQAEAAKAQVAAAQAKVSEAGVTFGHLRIVAPVSGQLVNRSVNVGSYVSPNQQIMAIIPDALWITANFKETQLVHMTPGQHVDIRIDAFPDVKFEGHVDSIQRGAGQAFALLPPQNATGNYVKVVQRVPVRILIDRPDPRAYAIGPGMSVVPTVKIR